MFNFFRKKKKTTIKVNGVNPQTDNEYLFYDFVEKEFAFVLKSWLEDMKAKGYIFKPEYERAIREKIKTGYFKNPYNFSEYFENKFDYIAIDFETANENRISACAIGLAFVKDNRLVYMTNFYIKPPIWESFTDYHINLHGITPEKVDYASTFEELWNYELSKYFNNNLIIFHNASMDLSILKQLFEYYMIENYSIRYLDTMQLAKKTGNPTKLSDLVKKLDTEWKYNNKHNPQEDAITCACVFGDLVKLYPRYENLVGELRDRSVGKKRRKKQLTLKIENENLDCIKTYSLSKDEVEMIKIKDKGFIFTGTILTERNLAQKFIVQNGGVIKSSITSKVDYVIIGANFGWSKIQKIYELNKKKNCNIKILTDSDFECLKNISKPK